MDARIWAQIQCLSERYIELATSMYVVVKSKGIDEIIEAWNMAGKKFYSQPI